MLFYCSMCDFPTNLWPQSYSSPFLGLILWHKDTCQCYTIKVLSYPQFGYIVVYLQLLSENIIYQTKHVAVMICQRVALATTRCNFFYTGNEPVFLSHSVPFYHSYWFSEFLQMFWAIQTPVLMDEPSVICCNHSKACHQSSELTCSLKSKHDNFCI